MTDVSFECKDGSYCHIKEVELNDMPLVIALYDQYDRPKAPPPDAARITELYHQLSAVGGCVFGAYLNDEIIGSCTFLLCVNFSWSGRPFGIIENVIVSDQHRRQGIGRLLLDAARERAQKLGCYKVSLMTGATRPEVHRFYKTAGFEPSKTGYQIRFI